MCRSFDFAQGAHRQTCPELISNPPMSPFCEGGMSEGQGGWFTHSSPYSTYSAPPFDYAQGTRCPMDFLPLGFGEAERISAKGECAYGAEDDIIQRFAVGHGFRLLGTDGLFSALLKVHRLHHSIHIRTRLIQPILISTL